MIEELIREARAWNEEHLRDYNYTSCTPFCPSEEHEHGLVGAERLIARLADALEAATAEPEWEYGHEGDTLVGVHANVSMAQAVEDAESLTRYWEPQCKEFRAVRRRKAGPWLPVGGEGVDEA